MPTCGALHFHRRLANLAGSLVVIVFVFRSIWRPQPLRLSTIDLASAKPLLGPATNKSRLTYYVADVPELTEWLIGNHTHAAGQFYLTTLNENSGEVWLHRGFDGLLDDARARNALESDVILIPSYLHLLKFLRSMIAQRRIEAKLGAYPDAGGVAKMVASRVVALGQHEKPHVLLIPTTNPSTSLSIGLGKLVAALERRGVRNLYSVGYERNTFWQRLPPARILPIPYVVVPDPSIRNVSIVDPSSQAWPVTERKTLLFYAGDGRPNAVEWSGCNRSMILPLINASSSQFNRSDIDIRLSDSKSSRLSHEEYHRRMMNSRYCLVLCGDTPTSRSLSSSIVQLCIPLFVGSRLRGRCDPPCHPGWGWTVLESATSLTSGVSTKGALTHLPFERQIDWSVFPELDEAQFAEDPVGTFDRFLGSSAASPAARQRQEDELRKFQRSFVYGTGSPINDDVPLGGAVESIWTELQHFLFPHGVHGL